ncbi:MAG: outer membrane beta-barrel protein [Tahibacter sp.]
MKCLAIAAAIACACLKFGDAAAQDNHPAPYFVELAAGKASVAASVFDDDSTQWSGRLGYRWGVFGVDAGYADLGGFNNRVVFGDTPVDMRLDLSGWTLGANLRLPLREGSNFTARSGVFGWKSSGSGVPAGEQGPVLTELPDESGTAWYAGIGFSFDFGANTSVGVNLDRYMAKSILSDFHINTYSVSLEQRF